MIEFLTYLNGLGQGTAEDRFVLFIVITLFSLVLVVGGAYILRKLFPSR